jgi:hypothetical protein
MRCAGRVVRMVHTRSAYKSLVCKCIGKIQLARLTCRRRILIRVLKKYDMNECPVFVWISVRYARDWIVLKR